MKSLANDALQVAGHRPARLSLVVALAALSLAGAACGKDKPAEEPPPEPVSAEGDKPADEADKPADEAGEKPAEGDDKKPDGATDEAGPLRGRDPKLAADDPKARLRAGRDRSGRRPVPARKLNDETPDAGADGGAAGATPTPGEPTPIAPGEPTPVVPGEPTPVVPGETAPVVAGEPTPAEPPPTPIGDGGPARPGEIFSEAGVIDAAAKLPLTVVIEILGKQLAAGVPLQGIAIVPGYGSIFYAASETSKFGLALQVWQDPSRREADDRFRRMRLQYPNAEDIQALAPSKAFFSYFETIQTLTWVEPTKRMVLSLTCGEGVCSHEQLVRLAKSARERL